MNDAPSSIAWEFITPRGVAAFARARWWNLFLAQFFIALIVAASVIWFLNANVCPVVEDAIHHLPDKGKISPAYLDWNGDSPVMLAEGRLLAFDVDLSHSGKIHSSADVQIEFGRHDIRIFSWLGFMEIPYAFGPPVEFNRPKLEPLWGAWQAEFLFAAAAGTFVWLFIAWWLLATIYFLPARLLAFLSNRDLNAAQSWRLSNASMLPASLLVILAMALYNFGLIGLVSLGFLYVAHLVLGWIYLFASLIFVPRVAEIPPTKNPFVDKS